MTTVVYPVMSLDEPIADEAFKFSPPENAKLPVVYVTDQNMSVSERPAQFEPSHLGSGNQPCLGLRRDVRRLNPNPG